MKKVIFLNLIITSISMSNVTTGFVEGVYNGEYDNGYKINEAGLSTEINLKNNGGGYVSLGATLKLKDVPVPINEHNLVDSMFDNSNIFIKYKLPSSKGLGGYLKGTLNPKIRKDANDYLSFKSSTVGVEGELNYEFMPNSKIAFNSKTEIPFDDSEILTTNKMYIEGKNIKNLKNIKASVELQNSYNKKSPLKYISVNSEGEYDITSKFKLNGKTEFRYQFDGKSKVKNILTDEDYELNSKDYAHSYILDASYLTLKDRLELTGGIFFQHIYHNMVPITVTKIGNIFGYPDANKYISDAIFNNFDNIQFTREEEAYLKRAGIYDEYNEILPKARKDYEVEQKKLFDSQPEFVSSVLAMGKIILENKKVRGKICENLEKIKNDPNNAKLLKDIRDKFYPDMWILEPGEYEGEDVLRPATTQEIIYSLLGKLGLDDKEKNKLYPKISSYVNNIDKYYKMDGSIKRKILNDYNFYKIYLDVINKPDNQFDGERDIVIDKMRRKIFKSYGSLKSEIDKVIDKMATKVVTVEYKVPENDFNYGLKLGAKYNITDRLILSAKGIFGANTNELNGKVHTKGYVRLENGIKYDYVNNNMVITPEFNIITKLYNIEKGNYDAQLILSPKLGVLVAPVENLKISGEIEVPFKFNKEDIRNINYSNFGIKTKMNIRYGW